VVRRTGRVLIEAALAHDPGIEAVGQKWGVLGERLIDAAVSGRPFSALMDASLGLGRPLVAIGAPVGAYYPEVARRLHAPLSVPEHAAVCNAVGAVAGVVSQTVAILVNQPTFKVFRVHDPAGSRDYQDPQPALEHAERVSRELAVLAARRAGAADPRVDTQVLEKRAQVGPGSDYLAEALVSSTAVGRPLVGHAGAHIV
jgi:N-methylhydantoinase A/oxoprolinase/acetone carboxylase beta subunit